MRWQLTGIQGHFGELSAAQVLAGVPLTVDAQGQTWAGPPVGSTVNEGLCAKVQEWLDPAVPNWVVLPHSERGRRIWWQERLGDRTEIGFGRAAVALALSQLNRVAIPGRFVAANQPSLSEPGVDAALALDWEPSDHGLAFELCQMDGRLDGKTDVGALLELGRNFVHQPEVLFCPGTVNDGNIERLFPFLAALGPWAAQEVRWEFAEASLGRLGVVGSLFNWAWLEAGYRLGEWQAPCAVIESDDCPLVGLSVVNWGGNASSAPGGLT